MYLSDKKNEKLYFYRKRIFFFLLTASWCSRGPGHCAAGNKL